MGERGWGGAGALEQPYEVLSMNSIHDTLHHSIIFNYTLYIEWYFVYDI